MCISAHAEAESEPSLRRCGFTVQNVGRVALLAPGIQRWPQAFWKFDRSLVKGP